MSDEPEDPTSKNVIEIEGIISAADKLPYVRILLNEEPIAQVSVALARQIAADILNGAARIEADAMILKFFEKSGFPLEAAGALMLQFRDFRTMLDEGVENSYHPPSSDPPEKVN